jgi:hypothetical protein
VLTTNPIDGQADQDTPAAASGDADYRGMPARRPEPDGPLPIHYMT